MFVCLFSPVTIKVKRIKKFFLTPAIEREKGVVIVGIVRECSLYIVKKNSLFFFENQIQTTTGKSHLYTCMNECIHFFNIQKTKKEDRCTTLNLTINNDDDRWWWWWWLQRSPFYFFDFFDDNYNYYL